MELMKWTPFREIEDIFDRYARGLRSLGRTEAGPLATGEWAPRVDIVETDKEFSIKAEIPEVKKEDVKIRVDNGVLMISGERKQEKEEKGKTFHRVERFYGSFTRSFALPDTVDQTKIGASFKDGMLNLSLPKTAGAQPKAIEVKIQ